MKFDEQSLNEYLVKKLEPLTEADPAILADYIIALLKKDKPLQELKKLCGDDLVEFLGHGTKSFVSDLFKTFEDGSIMRSNGRADNSIKPDSPLVTAALARQRSIREENPSISRNFSDSEEKEVSDDEDDDRNHKHRRRDNRPQPLEDSQGQFARAPFRRRNRPNENGQQFMDRRPSPMDFGPKTRMGRGFRPNNTSHFDMPTNSMRPPIGGRGRSMTPWDPLDPLGFIPQMPSLLGAGFSTAAAAPSTSWGSYGFMPGVSNGSLDPLHPLSLPGPLHPSMNPVGVGMPRQRCRDFEERGFCLRGDMCPMEHGMNRIVVEDVQSLSQFNLPVSLPATSILGAQTGGALPSTSTNKSAASKVSKSGAASSGLRIEGTISTPRLGPDLDVYDPDQPLLSNDQPETSGAGLRLPSPSLEEMGALWESSLTENNMDSLTPWERSRDGNFASARRANGSGEKKESDLTVSSISTDKTVPVSDLDGGRAFGKSSQLAQKSLFVSSIPQSSNRREALISHFRKFGEIVDIYIPANSEKAFIQFSKREEAEAALISPEAVMGNRFIKLRWAFRDNIPDGAMKVGPASVQPTPVQPSTISRKIQAPVRDNGEAKDSPAIQKTAAVMQKTPATKVPGKMENIESMKEELRKKQDSLKQKREEFMRQLEKLQKQTATATKSEVVAERPSKKPKTDECTEVPKTEEHEEQEKALEKRNPRETVISPHSKFSTATALPSPRSGKLPSQSPGFYANRFKIDNRPTGFRIISPLPNDLANADALKEHFSSFGELSGIELNTSDPQPSASISFATRSSAEKAFNLGNSWKGHNLQFMWVSKSASKPSKGSSSSSSSSSIAANGVVEGGEKGDSLVAVSLSTAECGDKVSLGDVHDGEGSGDAGLG